MRCHARCIMNVHKYINNEGAVMINSDIALYSTEQK